MAPQITKQSMNETTRYIVDGIDMGGGFVMDGAYIDYQGGKPVDGTFGDPSPSFVKLKKIIEKSSVFAAD